MLQTKMDTRALEIDAAFSKNALAVPDIMPGQAIAPLMLNADPAATRASTGPHPDYISWQYRTSDAMDHNHMLAALENRPDGLYRLKGIVLTEKGWFDIHAVGGHTAVTPVHRAGETALVGVGLKGRLSLGAVDKWWARVGSTDYSQQTIAN